MVSWTVTDVPWSNRAKRPTEKQLTVLIHSLHLNQPISLGKILYRIGFVLQNSYALVSSSIYNIQNPRRVSSAILRPGLFLILIKDKRLFLVYAFPTNSICCDTDTRSEPCRMKFWVQHDNVAATTFSIVVQCNRPSHFDYRIRTECGMLTESHRIGWWELTPIHVYSTKRVLALKCSLIFRSLNNRTKKKQKDVLRDRLEFFLSAIIDQNDGTKINWILDSSHKLNSIHQSVMCQ